MSGRGKSKRSIELIKAAYTILEEIQPASVRAVCYRLFTLGIIDSMSKANTNKVSTQLTWARENGGIPWSWIVDETRRTERVSAWNNLADYLHVVRHGYRRDYWADQPDRVEVWSEKGTVRGTLAPVLDEYGVAFRVMHGYGSATTLHQVAEETQDRRLTVLYVGDWDPSGLHMSEEDIPNRLVEYGGDVEIVRLALTHADARSGLPWFDVAEKRHDPRYRWFILRPDRDYRCVELDALSPVILRDRVEQAIRERLDLEAWDRAGVAEAAERESIETIVSAWPTISGQASKYSDDEASS
jgi:hypothetical protein